MWLAEIYLLGVIVGLIATQGGVATRLVMALLWPLGPLAFIITATGLLVVAGIAFPLFGVMLAGVVAAAWWLLR
jgi:hypothetical protein